ncbi:fructose-bisphosphatase class II [Agromyces sp. MMS24-K17]|uniref:fructose-bisphosphatase class II n=1 Tax=Agromyces sp. MMS24-K17 TaxID=3372850 RepID=UPI003754E7F7
MDAHPDASPVIDDRTVAGFVDAAVAAALAVRPLVGSGDPIAVDGAAVDAMRAVLAGVDGDGRVVIGEGEKDDAPMLHLGERFGRGGADAPEIDLAVDPVDGTRLAAAGRPGAMAVASIAPRGAFADLGPAHYLEKLVSWHPDASLDRPLGDLVRAIAAERGVAVSAVRVAVQERPRNAGYVAAARAAGAVVELFEHGDVERSIRAAQRGTDLDVVVGVGGAPEGVLTAAAVRALGGGMSARLAPQSEPERERIVAAGVDVGRVLGLDDLCAGPAACIVAAVTALDLGAGAVLEAATADEASTWVAVEGRGIVVTPRQVR